MNSNIEKQKIAQSNLQRSKVKKKTMAVSPKRSPLSSPSKSKLKQRKITWEIKKNLVKKRIMGLTDTKDDEESVNADRRIICYPPEEKPADDCDGVSTSAMERATKIEANLPIRFPSFVKNLTKSHVTGGFWLGLPSKFCVAHLPKHDETVVLVGESDEEYNTKYLVEKNGLSAGWRGFSIANKLLEGDVLVFELIKPCKFKVHIVRARPLTDENARTITQKSEIALTEESAVRCLLKLHAAPIETVMMDEEQPEENAAIIETVKMEDEQPEESAAILETMGPEYPKPVPRGHNQKKTMKKIIATNEPSETPSSNNLDDLTAEFPDGIRFSDSSLDFDDVKCFEDFKIQVDGLILDSEIPHHLKKKYYALCLGQKKILHENLIKGLNSKLACGMISETINIADAIRAAKPSAGLDLLESYDKTLKAFEDLGMSVGFLRARIGRLLGLCRESQNVIELKKQELSAAKDEMRGLKAKVSSVERSIEKLNDEIDRLKAKNKELGFAFKDIACAPW